MVPPIQKNRKKNVFQLPKLNQTLTINNDILMTEKRVWVVWKGNDKGCSLLFRSDDFLLAEQ